MSITYTYQKYGEKPEKHSNVPCFSTTSIEFQKGRPLGTLVYSPNKEALQKVLALETNPELYRPSEFLKDLLTTEGPIKTAIDIINDSLGYNCIDSDTCTCSIANTVPYKVSLLPLSLVRYLEEQTSLIIRYFKVLERSDSATQAFLWASSSHRYAGEYNNHSIVVGASAGVIASPEKIKETFKNLEALEKMSDILSPKLQYQCYSDIFLIRPYKTKLKDKQTFIKYQNDLLKIVKEKLGDTDQYITS